MEEKHYIRIPLPGEEDKKQSVQDNTSNLPPLHTLEQIVEKNAETSGNSSLPMDDEGEMTDEDILKLWDELRITTKTVVPELEPIIKVSYKDEEKDDHKEIEVGIFTKRDIHGVKAKQKQGKTTVLKVLLAVLLLGKMFRLTSCLKNPNIFWLDTEQQPSDVKQILTDIGKMTGLPDSEIDEHVHLYQLRTRTYKTLLRELTVNIKTYRPDVVFIDGVVKFVQSFND